MRRASAGEPPLAATCGSRPWRGGGAFTAMLPRRCARLCLPSTVVRRRVRHPRKYMQPLSMLQLGLEPAAHRVAVTSAERRMPGACGALRVLRCMFHPWSVCWLQGAQLAALEAAWHAGGHAVTAGSDMGETRRVVTDMGSSGGFGLDMAVRPSAATARVPGPSALAPIPEELAYGPPQSNGTFASAAPAVASQDTSQQHGELGQQNTKRRKAIGRPLQSEAYYEGF